MNMTGKGAWAAICPANVRYNKSLSRSAKLLYLELSALSDRSGHSKENNSYFAEFLNISERSVYNNFVQLLNAGLIEIEGEGEKRKIKLLDKSQEIVYKEVKVSEKDDPLIDKVFEQKVIDLWNEGVGSSIKLTNERKRKLYARLGTFTKEEVLEAVKNRIHYVNRSPWHNDPKNRIHKIEIELVLRNDKEMDKYLNAKQTNMFSLKEHTIVQKEDNTNILK